MKFLTAGESHGPALTGIIEGLPAGIPFSLDGLKKEQSRRKMGYGRGSRMKIETDDFQILSGIRSGESIGSPISVLLPNKDFKNWEKVMDPWENDSEKVQSKKVTHPRPGHADLTGKIKYQRDDMRDILERSSARETAMRVALGSICRQFLQSLDINIHSRVLSIGTVQDRSIELEELISLNDRADQSPVRMLSFESTQEATELIDQARKNGDTLGGDFEVFATNLPIGLGSYAQWNRRLDAKIGEAFLGLNAIKSVEMGLGKEAAKIEGSKHHDSYSANNEEIIFNSNNTGGVLGGMSTGEPLLIRASMKPISTLMKPLPSVNLETGKNESAHIERSDYCAVPSASIIGESLLCLILAELILEKFGGDSLKETKQRVDLWREQSKALLK